MLFWSVVLYVTPLLLNVKASVSRHFVGDKVNDCDGDFFKAVGGGDDMDRKKAFYPKTYDRNAGIDLSQVERI